MQRTVTIAVCKHSQCKLSADRAVYTDVRYRYATVTGFAKAVGEYAALSRVDLHLLALTYTLETAAHGDTHVRHSPAPPRLAARRRSGQGLLPGWGSHGGDWAEMDALADSGASTSQAAGIQFAMATCNCFRCLRHTKVRQTSLPSAVACSPYKQHCLVQCKPESTPAQSPLLRATGTLAAQGCRVSPAGEAGVSKISAQVEQLELSGAGPESITGKGLV